MIKELTKDEGRARVAELVRNFKRNESDYLKSSYNETQARNEFITPLLEAFGWDVSNRTKRLPLALREVIEEATVEVGEEQLSKKPDYELRLARQRKLFVEAKKPSINIDRDRKAAFQTRRYGYSASLPISVVTNFYQLAIYNCRAKPAETDEAVIARDLIIGYESLEAHFDELWDQISREAVYSGAFDRRFSIDASRRGAEQFDDFFLEQVRGWRERLAIDIYANTPGLSAEELTYAVQIFLSRIVFLRICEDREIEKYETLKNLNENGIFESLLGILRRADKFYDSGLFRLINDERLGIRISDRTLKAIISELYYPQSPYTFAVVKAEVLGEIYERFLGEVIVIRDGVVKVVSKPEVRESGGVVPTPRYIADVIVEKSLGSVLQGKDPKSLEHFTVADICCGSGIFLLSAYDCLLDFYLNWYLGHSPEEHIGVKIFEVAADQWRLTFEEKRRILVTHLRGVDIDSSAVEVAQFSVLLRLIEDESAAALKEFVERLRVPALPSLDGTILCGNSLVSALEWQGVMGTMSAALREKVNPFSWSDEFRDEMARGGFDIIVGNPPYIRIQSMTSYSPEEVEYYQNPGSPYKTAGRDNFDKYALFVERSISLIRPNGRIGLIVPNKFMTIHAGKALRKLLAAGNYLQEIVDFGIKQVFGRKISNYTCILILGERSKDYIEIEKAGPLESWRYGNSGTVMHVPEAEVGEEPWNFANTETRALISRVKSEFTETLDSVSEILVGVQTSADKVFILHSEAEGAGYVKHAWNGMEWRIEREVLRPCLHDVVLNAYSRPRANSWIIFPYELENDPKGKTKARLIQPDEFAARYPGCWAYLNARKSELDARKVAGGISTEKQWYQYGRSQSLTKFDSPKIILPVLSIEPRYSYDEANTLFTGGGNGPYYMIRAKDSERVSNYYLLAILNHPLSEAMIRTKTSLFRGGFYSHGKQFIQNLPIPIPTDTKKSAIEERVLMLLSRLDGLLIARMPHERTRIEREISELKVEIETLVSGVYGLSDEDMEIVRSVPIPE